MLAKALLCLSLVMLTKATTEGDDRIQILERSLQQARVDNEHLRYRLAEMEDKYNVKVTPDTTAVGFTATVGQRNLTNIGAFETIIFDAITSNVGYGYSTATGIFRAPVSGVYVFHVDITVDPLNFADLHIIQAPASGATSYDRGVVLADSSNSNTLSTGSRTFVLNLSLDDQVWVRNGLSATIELHGNGFSSFSGYLLGSSSP